MNEPAPRRLIFLSHATPQDNDFAKWLATQLAIAGYEVWCDLTELLGGERFWHDIEEAIDRHAFRVLFVSTLESNRKPGTLKELRFAFEAQEKHGLSDFVVPLKVDQFPFEATHHSIQNLNFVRFDESWQEGLTQILKLLEREGAPKSPAAGAACVLDWYERSQDARRRRVVREDRCYSNWFEIRLPKRIYLHPLHGDADRLPALARDFPFPNRVLGGHLVTFATSLTVQEALGPVAIFDTPAEVSTTRFADEGDGEVGVQPFDASNIVTDIVQQAWNMAMRDREMCSHELASGYHAWFFKNDQIEKNRAHFTPVGAKKASYRQLVGNKSKRLPEGGRRPDGYWHYAVSASPQLHGVPKLALHHHVIFTDDGETPWTSTGRMHRARRSVCKQWWNAEWRDRLLAICAILGGAERVFRLPTGGEEWIEVSMAPMEFTSPWSYFEDNETGLDEAAAIELVEDDDTEEAPDELE
ncbi:MAG TPA: toll/interleukin-1 receptor domain-containing protein [Allosphingosinicella sp.]